MRIFCGLLCILLIVGCSQKDTIPSGVIGKEEMGDILWDMMQADQYATNYLIKDSAKVNVKMETLKLYEEVFRLHKVNREEFRKSFQFYQDHPDITRVLFDSLISKGNRLRAATYSHPPTTTPSTPVVKPGTNPVITPGGKTPVAPSVAPGRPGGTLPSRPSGTLPNQPGSAHLPVGFLRGRDSARLHRGARFLPGQTSPAPRGATPGGARPFQGKDTTRH